MRFHAKERLIGPQQVQWQFEERSISMAPSQMLLVRILVAKVMDESLVFEILRNIPIRQDTPDWNCVWWVAEALVKLGQDGRALGTSVLEWNTVKTAAMQYCQSKIDQHRFDGQASFDMSKTATYDLIKRKETIP